MAEIKNIRLHLLELNEGQMYGLPKNPRWIRDARYEALKKSIEDAPEMLSLRELLVYPMDDIEGHEGKYIIIGGNMRYRACLELGYQEVPCKVIPLETPVKKLREYVIKDNEAFDQQDWDVLSNEWDTEELQTWGMELDYIAPGGGDNWDDMDDPDAEVKKPELTKEELRELIKKASEGSVVDYADDTDYDLSLLYRKQADKAQKMLDDAIARRQIRPEIVELCKMRIAQCTILNFDEIMKYYRSADSTAAEKELLKKLYLVFITPQEAVEAGMLKLVAETGKIFEQEISGGAEEIAQEYVAENEEEQE